MRTFHILLCAFFLFPSLLTPRASLAEEPESQFNLIDSALAQVGLQHDDVRFDEDEMALWGGDRWCLNHFTLFHHHPFRLPKYGGLFLNALSENVTNPTELVARAARLVDFPIYRGLTGDPLKPYIDYPDTVTAPSITRSKNILTDPVYRPLNERIDLIYRLLDDDEFLFKRALKDINKDKYRERLFEYFVFENQDYHDLVYELIEKVDFDRMMAGAQDLAEAVRRAASGVDTIVFPEVKREEETREGLIVIGTSGDDVYEYFKPPLIIFDGGGDDTYHFSGYPNDYPFSVIIDAGGNDRYISTDTARPGIAGAVIGMSVLIDLNGDDYYEAVNVAQGAGIFGVGMVIDHQGDDIYSGRTLCQGAATFGLGILADSSGSDSLYCLGSSQAFGYTRGCGLVVNLEGDDRYIAEDDSIFNPSPQTAEHNASLAQGVGFGKRADYIDGHSWAGGVGLLCDARGDDFYSAGLFAQGCAYWYALGMLLDGSGADRYNGVWYVQGSGAHFAVGYLDDFAGNDVYTATLNMAVGAGHDFTVGYFNERSGDDRYIVPNLSLGGGNANGIGIFHDHAGNDIYTTHGGTTLGRANRSDRGPRQFLNVFGIFVDGGGIDTYDEVWAGNEKRWIGPPSILEEPVKVEIGVGIDR
jgi:hypothetical protein